DGVIFDITERKQAEEVMRREAQILAHVHDCVVTTDLQGNITLWNRGAERVFGYGADEALGQHISLVYFDEDLPMLRDDIIAPMLEGSENELQARCRHKSGREVFVHLSLSVIRDENGSPIELIGYSLDITERKKAEKALRLSEQRLKLAQVSAGAGVWEWDITTGKLEWSDELFHLFGLDPSKGRASFETWRRILHPDDRVPAEKQIEAAVESRMPLSSEYRIVLESGQIRWINALGDVTCDGNGEVERMSGICLDITDRKLAEEEIRGLAKFPAEDPFPVLRLRADGTILYSNSPGKVLLEQWDCEVGQKAPADWYSIARKSLRYRRNLAERVQCGERLFSFAIAPIWEGKYVNLYGRDITVQEQIKGLLRKDRDQLEVRVRERTAELLEANEQLTDEIEQRKRTEQSLRLEHARLDALLSLSQMTEASVSEMAEFILEEGIALTGSKIGFVGFLNEDESIYTLDAVSKNVMKECEVVGDPMKWRVDDAGLWADAIRQRRTLFVNDYGKAQGTKKGFPPGHPHVDRFMIVPGFEDKRVALAGVGNKASDYDASDERQIALLLAGMWNHVQRDRARRELQEANEELERRVEQRTEELHRSNKDLDEFAHIVSHDLREPLRAVGGFVELLDKRYRDKLDGKAGQYIQFAMNGANRMSDLISGLLECSRVQTHGETPRLVPSRAALRTAMEHLQDKIAVCEAVITSDELPEVNADGRQLTQLFRNLLDNAIKFRGEAKPDIHVGCAQDGERWRFSVRDNGIGIDPQHHERIFKIFQRLHSLGENPSYGVGLTICQKIVHRHGGQIWVESEEGRGSTFHFTI
ncbi:MAG: PAS domain S-box protein, partial [Sedimentisphaerales bacterium]